jgi:hypothetical protein
MRQPEYPSGKELEQLHEALRLVREPWAWKYEMLPFRSPPQTEEVRLLRRFTEIGNSTHIRAFVLDFAQRPEEDRSNQVRGELV